MAKKIKRGKTSVSVEIHNSFIKLCEAAFYRRKCTYRLVKKELSSREAASVSQEIRALFNAQGISQKKVLLNIPRHLVMARVLHLPSTNDDEIRDMVKIEAAKQMPYASEETIIGHRTLEKFKDGYSDVLLTIAQAGTINRPVNILKNAGLTVEKVALSSESLFGWYSLIKKEAKKFPARNVALVNADSEYIDIAVVEGGNLAFTRAFSHGTAFDLQGIKEKALDEIKKSVSTYQKEKGEAVEKIVISGAARGANAIADILRKELNIPLEIVAQARGVELDLKATDVDLNEASFVELIGLSAKGEDIRINLLPEGMKEEAELGLLKKGFLRTSILAGCIILVASGVIAKEMFDKSRYLSLLDSEIRTMEPQVAKARRMRDDIKIIKNELQKKPLAIDILTEIYGITPAGITFNRLDYESGKSLALKGSAPSLDGIIKFITILEDSQYFESVKVKYTSKKLFAPGEQPTDFEVICLLSRVE